METWSITRSSDTRAPAPKPSSRSSRRPCAISSRRASPRTGPRWRPSSTGWRPALNRPSGTSVSDPYALMWSGGKDSALALDRAATRGLDVTRLLSFYDSATRRVRFHATRVPMLEAQAAAVGIDLRAIPTTWVEMDGKLRRGLWALREEGYVSVDVGNIHLASLRTLYESR